MEILYSFLFPVIFVKIYQIVVECYSSVCKTVGAKVVSSIPHMTEILFSLICSKK